jgi:hypothetical protein
MDGTIVCSRHRYRTIEKNGRPAIDLQYWIENEHRAYNDSLLPLAAQYRKDIADARTFVIIATARHLQRADRKFIREKLGRPDAIVSRAGRTDVRGGADLKIAGLKRIFEKHNLHDAVKVFWEDNFSYLSKVCAAIGARGVLVPSAQGW